MSAPQAVLVSMFVSALMVGPLAISATADPIVVIPGALGYVDTTVTDAGERGAVKRGSTEKGSAAAAVSAGVRCTYTPVGLAGLGSDLSASLAALIGGLNS